METQTLRELIERLNGQYRSAMSTAYCPSSDAHRKSLRAVSATNAALDTYLNAVDSVVPDNAKLTGQNRRGNT